MMNVITITNQSIEEFCYPKIPQGLMAPFKNKIRVLKQFGRECIGAFVFEADDIFHFEVTEPDIPEGVDVYISFIDLENLILIVRLKTFKQSK